MHRRAGLIVVLVSLFAAVSAGARPHGVAAVLADDAAGEVGIRYADGTTIVAPKGRDQKSLSHPALATDRQTVGWLGNYDNCCQSYPIPQQLVIWRSGRIIMTIDAGAAMIWNWRFYDRGRKVGFAIGPTHGAPYSYKLFDVASGKPIAESAGQARNLPAWARLLAPVAGK
jgi:hypothetical protein